MSVVHANQDGGAKWLMEGVLQSPTDGRARQPRDRGESLQTAPSRRSELAGREYPSPALIELRATDSRLC
jgi:hypothetical protein